MRYSSGCWLIWQDQADSSTHLLRFPARSCFANQSLPAGVVDGDLLPGFQLAVEQVFWVKDRGGGRLTLQYVLIRFADNRSTVGPTFSEGFDGSRRVAECLFGDGAGGAQFIVWRGLAVLCRGRAVKIAGARANDAERGNASADLACASDGYFPFADGLEAAIEAGCSAVIAPGGSVRDEIVIEAANKYGIALVFSSYRYFLH